MRRLVAAFVVAGGVGWLAWCREMAVGQQFLITTTLLFMLSPTQFPWYYLWLHLFLAGHPHPALLLNMALLPIYYLRPLMGHYGHGDTFDQVVVWVQHGPVIIWLARDWILRRGRPHSKTICEPAFTVISWDSPSPSRHLFHLSKP